MDPTDFRAQFPEFFNPLVYPDALIQQWMNYAQQLVNADRWQGLTTLGVYLATAHYLVLEARDKAAAEASGVPGTSSGIVASKSVDKVSISYDASSIKLENGGEWGMTSYGIRYLSMARRMGAGGWQTW